MADRVVMEWREEKGGIVGGLLHIIQMVRAKRGWTQQQHILDVYCIGRFYILELGWMGGLLNRDSKCMCVCMNYLVW